jgi:asparagine synthase (glutamine-hydrolysing)
MLERASWFNDEPLAHGHDVHLNVIAAHAKSQVTVLLSGEGADEIMGGYVRYRPLRFPGLLTASAAWLPPMVNALGLGGRWRKLARFLRLGSIDQFILYNPCNVFPTDLAVLGLKPTGNFPFRQALLEEAKRYSAEPARQAMYLDQHAYLVSLLHRNDRMTMAASIECREPLLDYELVEIAAALPTKCLFGAGQGKYVFRQAMAPRLPESIVKHHKWGFGVPWADYLRTDPALRQFLDELPKKAAIASGPFDPRAIRQLIDGFLAGDNQRLSLLLQLMMVAIWHDVALDRHYAPAARLEKNFAAAA